MSGPISIVTIDDSPRPECRDYTLTLTFKAQTWGGAVDPDLATQIGNVLRDWRDGRYSFDAEMIQRGLKNVVEQAIFQTCQKRADEKYGNEMVQVSPTCRTSRAHMEAEKEFKAIMDKFDSGRLWIEHEPKVRIERVTCSDDSDANE